MRGRGAEHLILLDERPDLRGAAPFGGASFAAEMDGWIERNGVHEYKLFWLMDEAAFTRMAAAPQDLRYRPLTLRRR